MQWMSEERPSSTFLYACTSAWHLQRWLKEKKKKKERLHGVYFSFIVIFPPLWKKRVFVEQKSEKVAPVWRVGTEQNKRFLDKWKAVKSRSNLRPENRSVVPSLKAHQAFTNLTVSLKKVGFDRPPNNRVSSSLRRWLTPMLLPEETNTCAKLCCQL